MRLHKVVIIGLGLIGGSIGLALKRREAVRDLVGVDKDRETMEKALALGAINRICDDFKEALMGAQLVIVAVHLNSLEEVVERMAPYITAGTVVTDVTSVKGQSSAIFRKYLPRHSFFIGGHPMAGSESSGIEAADPFLFENAIYVLTPTGGEPQEVLELMHHLVRIVGAKPLLLEHSEHDLLVAMVSHLPHIVAAALNLTVSEVGDSEKAFALAAGGFRDTTRIASSHPEMWSDILIGNRDSMIKVLTEFEKVILHLKKCIGKGEKELLFKYLKKAKEIRDAIPNRPGLLPRVFEAIVTLPDRPGEIGRIGTLLGDKGINISEIEILRVREGDGGTMRLAFASEEDVEAAKKVLVEEGYKVRRRL